MSNNAYLRFPTLHKDDIVFVTDDDLWKVSLLGGSAKRLTSANGRVKTPVFSPNGEMIAFVSDELGQYDLYLIDNEGGHYKRLTYCGDVNLKRWIDDKTILISHSEKQYHRGNQRIYKLDIETLNQTEIEVGLANDWIKAKGFEAIGRRLGDPARWKRYQGGTAGTLWVKNGKKNYEHILKNIKNNIACLQVHNGRIYFISDHEGHGNIYSCLPTGRGLKRITHFQDYYIRNFCFYEEKIVFQKAGELFVFELGSEDVIKLDINIPSSFAQSIERYEDAGSWVNQIDIGKNEKDLTIISRGQLFNMNPWVGGVKNIGDRSSRYTQIACGDDFIIAVKTNEDGEDEIVQLKELKESSLLKKNDWGKIIETQVSPCNKYFLFANNRNELWLLEISNKKLTLIDKQEGDHFSEFTWSPHSRYIAYRAKYSYERVGIKIYDFKTKKSQFVLTPILKDFSPSFDKKGEYLYFVSVREFFPTMSEVRFHWDFPFATRVYCLPLNENIPHPVDRFNWKSEDEEEEEKEKKKSKKKPSDAEINFQDTDSRLIPIRGIFGGIDQIFAAENQIFVYHHGISPNDPIVFRWAVNNYQLTCIDLKTGKDDTYETGIYDVKLSRDKKHLMYIDTDGDVRLIKNAKRPTEGNESNRKDGWVDLSRAKLRIDPKQEWDVIFKEAWILQREHFWDEKMSRINWQEVYSKYHKILPKVHTRTELSDLLWEMQGELGTSHCYEFEGDYHKMPDRQTIASLGADFTYVPSKKAFRVDEVISGDSWKYGGSPLKNYRCHLNKGDMILAIDGKSFHSPSDFYLELQGKGGKEISLIVQRKSKKQLEELTTLALHSDKYLRYRSWVEKNKAYVHKKTNNKIGYVHIPDMSLMGISEFYSSFLVEVEKEGLIIDVRYNGGGNVSQHILALLSQKVVGFDQSRWFGQFKYPSHGVNGPLVCLTNEFAGSDGDIFSHCFKLMGLGKLIGKRTWGGVVGIWPRYALNDGTWTSQPEFSFWFKDVGWGVENYGTEPNIEVDITPKDAKENKDPQLDRAIKEVLSDYKKNPPLKPNLKTNRPNLKAPKLPKN